MPLSNNKRREREHRFEWGTFGSLVDPWYGCIIRSNKHEDYKFIQNSPTDIRVYSLLVLLQLIVNY